MNKKLKLTDLFNLEIFKNSSVFFLVFLKISGYLLDSQLTTQKKLSSHNSLFHNLLEKKLRTKKTLIFKQKKFTIRRQLATRRQLAAVNFSLNKRH